MKDEKLLSNHDHSITTKEFDLRSSLFSSRKEPVVSFLNCSRAGLQYRVSDGQRFCHNTVVSSVDEELNSWIGTCQVRNKSLSLHAPENLCLYSLCPVPLFVLTMPSAFVCTHYVQCLCLYSLCPLPLFVLTCPVLPSNPLFRNQDNFLNIFTSNTVKNDFMGLYNV